jgi:RpiB/LacA/LacB family sugar-phosphate isomerase
MRIALGCDHRGFPYKADMVRALREDGHEVVDLGTFSTDPADYPDYARLVGVAVRDGRAETGLLICGSGAGVSIAANKIRGVRAALCHDLFTARQSREDDDANVLCLGTGVVSLPEAIALARTFVTARFSHEERHARRLAKVLALEAADPPPLDDAWATPRPDGADHPLVREALERLQQLDAGARIWRKDARLWSESPAAEPSIVNRLGWLDMPTAMTSAVPELQAFAAEVRREIDEVVLLGMGGSSLAADVFARSFGPAPGHPTLSVLDTTDPDAIRAARARLVLARTLFLVSSKSGTTVETLALYRFFRGEVERAVSATDAGRHFVAITDAGSPLDRLATEHGFRRVFHAAPDLGGRYSALSCFGLLPGALLGVDVARLLERAQRMATACGPSRPVAENPALRLGAILAGWGHAGRDKVTLVLSPAIAALGAWIEQLVDESTGTDERGLVAIADEPLGPPAVYGNDRVFVAITLGTEASIEAALQPLEAAGHPVIRLGLADHSDLGAEFFRWEMAVAAACVVLGVNAFDEPDVARAKDATAAALATFVERGRLPEWPIDEAEDVARTLALARPGDWVAVLAYLTPDGATTAALADLRRRLRDATRLPTTTAFGPRYLHSTGQLHKGGPPTPILLLLTPDDAEDLPIPGERYGFATLRMAQALGDLSTLRAAHRRALWLALPAPTASAIEHLTRALQRTLSEGAHGVR